MPIGWTPPQPAPLSCGELPMFFIQTFAPVFSFEREDVVAGRRGDQQAGAVRARSASRAATPYIEPVNVPVKPGVATIVAAAVFVSPGWTK